MTGCDAGLGLGWVAEEALAIGVYASLKAEGDFEAGVRAAVNHSGDSDSTGSMAGQILGTIVGVEALPARWKVLREMVRDVGDPSRSMRTRAEHTVRPLRQFPAHERSRRTPEHPCPPRAHSMRSGPAGPMRTSPPRLRLTLRRTSPAPMTN